jgi:hypothetical protein
VRQRNDTPHAWSFAATPATDTTPEQPPFVVQPGETTDRPVLLDGWTALDDEPAKDTSKASADEPAKTTPKRRATADSDKDGGEQR